MTAQWQVLTQLPIGGSIQSVIDTVDGVLSAIEAALALVTTALEVVRAFALTTLNLLKTIVDAVLALIEELIFDLLEFNVAFTLHVNMNWNPFWVYNKEKERNPRTGRLDPRLVDFVKDRQFPWAGTGLTGWLLDLLASTKDPTDPFRPVSDETTSVYGVMIIKGIANPADAENSLNLEDWTNLFTNWSSFNIDFTKVKSDVYYESNSKLGTMSLLDTFGPFVQMGPKDQQILSIQNAIVGNPLAPEILSFYPTPGSYPKWVSIPMAAVVPPLQNLFANLQKALGLLRFGDDTYEALGKLIQAIQDKIDTLAEAVQQVQDAINLLISLAAFLTDSYIVVHDIPSGGMDVFIADVLAASDAPDFGRAGIVVGATFLATQPDAQATIDKFMQILGIQTSAYLATTTVYKEALDETFQELFP